MRINVKDHEKGKLIEEVNVLSHILKEDFNFIDGKDLELLNDVRVNSNLSVSNGLVSFNFDVLANFQFICSRCLKEFKYDLELELKESMNLSNLDEDVFVKENYDVVFEDYVRNYIILNIPQKKLCDASCLGLCQTCGVNLNDDKCSCKHNSNKEAFLDLANIFGDLKEV